MNPTPHPVLRLALHGGSLAALVGCPGSGPAARPAQAPETPAYRDVTLYLGAGRDDDAPVLVAAEAQGLSGLKFSARDYRIGSSAAFVRPCRFEPGAVLHIAPGCRVEFRGGIAAGVHPIFRAAAGAKVVIRNTEIGHPEWWGDDARAGIQACLETCPVTQLQMKDYYIYEPIRITTPKRTLRGVGKHWNGADRSASRIIIVHGAEPGIHVCGADDPVLHSNANFLQEVRIQDLDVERAPAGADPLLALPAEGGRLGAAAGIRLERTLYARVERVTCQEHSIGFLVSGTTRTVLEDCYAVRSEPLSRGGAAPAGSGGDFFYGYWLHGGARYPAGDAGEDPPPHFLGNQSTRIINCSAAMNMEQVLEESVGFFLDGAFRDTHLHRPETTRCATGIRLDGTQEDSPWMRRLGNVNLHITEPILDTFSRAGLEARDIADLAAVTVTDGYAAPAQPGPGPESMGAVPVCLQFTHCRGSIRVSGWQSIGLPHPKCKAVVAARCRGLDLDGNMHLDFRECPIEIEDCAGVSLRDHCRNEVMAAGPAVRIKGATRRSKFEPKVTCAAPGGGFQLGVLFEGAEASRNEVSCTLIDPAAVARRSKVWYNHEPVADGAPFGEHNLATGILD
jgi:hypothetical protein